LWYLFYAAFCSLSGVTYFSST